MSFVRLENLNDFIQPGTACIKPAEKKAPGVVAKVTDISLTDCLACSGCITSAETVLVQQQNHEELFKIINDNKIAKDRKDIVVSLSLQSIASLGHKHSMDAQETAQRLASFLVSLGCDRVYDINLARHLALVESYREFKNIKDNRKGPLIGSACPGWICYAEKTNGNLIIPHLSKVRSPQQIMGSLIKRRTIDGKKPSVYHITLMPCFDKKLEASRKDFRDDCDQPDVDCVITPLELEEILNDEGVTLADFDRRPLDTIAKVDLPFDHPLTSHTGTASGGYAENLLIAEASEILGDKSNSLKDKLRYSQLRNNDFVEVTLDSSETGDTRLPKVAIVNGFRNIQTVVQRLKRNVLKYDYIEVMACPSGCINGGAQCRQNFGETQEESIEATRQVYQEVPCVDIRVSHEEEVNARLFKSLGIQDKIDKLLYTEFHAVPKMQDLAVSW